MTTHELKIWPEFFRSVVEGSKTFELRKNDRGFMRGDILRLREFDPEQCIFTGNGTTKRVTYVLSGPVWGLEEGYVILALGDPDE